MKTLYQTYVDAVPHNKTTFRLLILPTFVGFLVYLAPGIFQMLFNLVFPAPLTEIGSLPAALSMVTTVFLALVILPKIAGCRMADLGLNKRGWFKQVLIGEFGGGLLLSLVVFIIWMLGAVNLTKVDNPSSPVLTVGLIFFLFQGTWEEIIYRSYLMPHFSKLMGDKWSILLSSALFTLGHALNPGMQALPVLNLFLASVVFSLIYYRTGSLLIIGVGHGLWNYSQGFIFGAEVSGNAVTSSIFTSKAVAGKDLISGGTFGFEGGLVTTLVALVLIVLFIYFPFGKSRAEK
ncbi:CPBP family intramembrane glutamic endopeptidase [Streptococcus orisratti]|uniref:CPBP family intramembrane glutamic endopeptidase n=1 Tax=Streptococcus orisratti TaxID=114652 RepID=UPI00036B9DF3|nr:type II CAAX endopeptidase family protein [Streptococcus orisratti]